MDLAQNPQYLRSLRQAVTQFRDAFADLMRLCEYTGLAPGLAPYVLPRPNVGDEELREAKRRVAIAAGRAAKAPSLTRALFNVQGQGVVDPIANWQSVMQPKPVFQPDDITATADSMVGRLDAMIDEAEAFAPPQVGVENLHPLIWGAARPLWQDEHYRHAVATAAETLVATVRARVDRRDVDATALWQQVFSANAPKDGDPRLRWPGNPGDRDVKTMNDGLRQFAPGVEMTIRNPAVHLLGAFDPQVALEMLGALSLLARWVDLCDRLPTDDEDSPSTWA